jgi:hypothetical protein
MALTDNSVDSLVELIKIPGNEAARGVLPWGINSLTLSIPSQVYRAPRRDSARLFVAHALPLSGFSGCFARLVGASVRQTNCPKVRIYAASAAPKRGSGSPGSTDTLTVARKQRGAMAQHGDPDSRRQNHPASDETNQRPPPMTMPLLVVAPSHRIDMKRIGKLHDAGIENARPII